MYQGRTAEAEPLLRFALERLSKMEGEERAAAGCSRELASCLHGLGQNEEAERLMDQAVYYWTKLFGPEHVEIAVCMNARARWACSTGRHEDGEHFWRRELAIRRNAGGPGSADALAALSSLAGCLGSQGRFEEAHALYQESLELSEGEFGADAVETHMARVGLGWCLGELGRYAEGEPLLLESFYCLPGRPGDESPRRHAATDLVRLYEGWDMVEPDRGHAEQAHEWRERLAVLDAQDNMISYKPCDPPDEALAAAPR
jgi:tetratricopeptide (TPR) repeat protein